MQNKTSMYYFSIRNIKLSQIGQIISIYFSSFVLVSKDQESSLVQVLHLGFPRPYLRWQTDFFPSGAESLYVHLVVSWIQWLEEWGPFSPNLSHLWHGPHLPAMKLLALYYTEIWRCTWHDLTTGKMISLPLSLFSLCLPLFFSIFQWYVTLQLKEWLSQT